MIIGMTGSIGSGKETLVNFFMERGFKYYVTSKLLAEELARRGIEITRKNMQDLGDELRKKNGAGALMRMLLEKINVNENCILDSLRNPREAEFLRSKLKNFILIAIDAPKEIRFQRIIERGKPSDPKNWDEFLEVNARDLADPANPLGQQVAKCMKLADFKLINDGTIEEFQEKIQKLYSEIMSKDANKEKSLSL